MPSGAASWVTLVFAAGSVITGLHYTNESINPPPNPATVTSASTEPSIEIVGGDPFFLPKGNEQPIRGPVFPRGRGPGPLFRIQADCLPGVQAWISGPGGERVADLDLAPLGPGSFSGRWPWSSTSGWQIPGGIPVGEYNLHVRSACHDREALAPFYVVFDPAAVGGPARSSFDSTAVWFGASPNSVHGRHYYLHCSDARVFGIAIRAASGHTVPHDAAIAIARAEEALFAYSLRYQTNDVVDLLENHTSAQCADDAACLTALLRSMGIPAYLVTADAGLEVGAADWTFDTWVELLTAHEGAIEWRVLHPHEYPGMQPERRGVFGTRDETTKGFNDLIIKANERWIGAQLDDGTEDVRYGRNACGEPNRVITKPPWVDELCESGYWARPHWDCAGVQRRSLISASSFRMTGGEPTYGGRLSGTVHLVSPREDRPSGHLAVELVTHRPEGQAFAESVLQTVERSVATAPHGGMTLPFDLALPPTVLPGRELYLRARLNERTALLWQVQLPPTLRATLSMPVVWQEGAVEALRVLVHNASDFALRGVEVGVEAPHALSVEGRRTARLDVLAPGEERELTFVARAIAGLPSGSLHVAIATANGGGLMLRQPFRVEAE